MNYTKPFYVNGLLVSVHKGKIVKVYLNDKQPIVEEKQEAIIDGVMQYLMDEEFVTAETCEVEIYNS